MPESEGKGKTSHGFSTRGRHAPASAPSPDSSAGLGICPGSLLRHTLGGRGRETRWHRAGAVMPRPSLKAGSLRPAQCVTAEEATGEEDKVLLAGGGMQETSYRTLHLLGQHDEVW